MPEQGECYCCGSRGTPSLALLFFRPSSHKTMVASFLFHAIKSTHPFFGSIGRITKGLLLQISDQVDVIEPVAKFTDTLHGQAGIGTIFNVGLQDWQPQPGAEYDIIWTQWCLGHLKDAEVVTYLQTCKTVLRPDSGVIVVKENISTSDVFDEEDSSVTRSVGI